MQFATLVHPMYEASVCFAKYPVLPLKPQERPQEVELDQQPEELLAQTAG